MFRTALRYLRFKPEDGLHVIARGRISVYEPKGEYQLVCEHMEPHGVGARQLAFEQLKRRLQAEGLFDAQRKRPLPALPRRIGIVTSLDGAAIRDIVKVLRRRAPRASLLIRPARVQGDGAADEVARALAALCRVDGVDVIIVGRGGGSVEDLWAFNEERVARAIAAAPVPIVSAVGHEVDVTIADFVADVRAPTPSAAAEMVVAAHEEFCSRIDRLTGRLHAAVRGGLQRRQTAVHLLVTRRGLAAFTARLAMRGRYATEATHQLTRCDAKGRRRPEARIRVARPAPRGARSSATAGIDPRPADGRTGANGSGRRSATPSRRRRVSRAGGPARKPQPAGGARARVCGLLERRPIGHHPQRRRRQRG